MTVTIQFNSDIRAKPNEVEVIHIPLQRTQCHLSDIGESLFDTIDNGIGNEAGSIAGFAINEFVGSIIPSIQNLSQLGAKTTTIKLTTRTMILATHLYLTTYQSYIVRWGN
jgi:hypothetical protein